MERQIGEFYSPILGLVEQYLVVGDVKKEILEKGKDKLNDEQKAILDRFVYEKFYEPIHQSLAELLDQRLYLLEKGKIPASFRDYLCAAVQEKMQYRLWAEQKIETKFASGKTFPKDFHKEVSNTLVELLERQERILRGEEIPEGWGI
ncbi:MAG: hypothetical protein ACJ76N_28520 [Thermoanaerobaculia bacterium]